MNSSKAFKIALPPPGIYHIRVTHTNSYIEVTFITFGYNTSSSVQEYLVEDENSDGLSRTKEPSRKGLFRLSHNDDGTISLFSLTLNKYVCSNPHYSSHVGFYDDGEIAKFELRKPEKPSNGAVKLLVGTKFYSDGGFLYDEERRGDLFEFLPVKE